MGIERREWPVTIGGREIQLWTRTTWMGGACRVSLGECAGFQEYDGLKEMRGKIWTDFQIPDLGPGRCKLPK